MPISYDIDEQENLVVAKVTGQLTDDDVTSFEADFLADGRLKPGFRGLFDATAIASTPIESATIQTLLDMESKCPERFAGSRRALVFHESVGWEMAKEFERQADGNVIVFCDLHTARIWLGCPEPKHDSAPA